MFTMLFLALALVGGKSQNIWNKAEHSAFTDLAYHSGRWFVVFRESDEHVKGKDGTLHLLESSDGSTWTSIAEFAEKGIDLRDPKLSVTPDGRLMLLAGGSRYAADGVFLKRQSRVAFSLDGKNWSNLTPILETGDWLWRVTWHKGKAYGIVYRASKTEEWTVALVVSDDGLNYRKIKQFDISDKPNEATVRFLPNGEMVALLRREPFPEMHAFIGKSMPPYTDWSWKDAGIYLGGPNFLILPDNTMIASGRYLTFTSEGAEIERTILAKMTPDGLQKILELPSGGDDTSYPGMVYKDGIIWVSYYSSHEGKSAIYLAKISCQKDD